MKCEAICEECGCVFEFEAIFEGEIDTCPKCGCEYQVVLDASGLPRLEKLEFVGEDFGE